jgi:hypothetical protein
LGSAHHQALSHDSLAGRCPWQPVSDAFADTFADGMTDELILTGDPRIASSPASVVAYKGA